MTEIAATATRVESKSQPGILGGAMIVAGTSIGAGMFALPLYSAGMWFGWSVLIMLACWYVAYSAAMLVAESSLNYGEGASYATIAEDSLGKTGKWIAVLSVAFVCQICNYAYVSGGSSMVTQMFSNSFGMTLPNAFGGLIFGGVLAVVVILGSRAVDRVSTIMLGGMVMTFLTSSGSLMGEVSAKTLFPAMPLTETMPFIWVAIPVFITSFAFHGAVPSIVKHYGGNANLVRKALLLGTAITGALYIVWNLVIMGNLPREDFARVIAEGGNVAGLISAIGQSVNIAGVESSLMLFGKLALATSFLGVTLGVMDMMRDNFKLGNNFRGTLIAAAVTFGPPITLSTIAPDGFMVAIGYAGLVAAIGFTIIPAMMADKLRRRGMSKSFRLSGGSNRIKFVFYFGVLALASEVANMIGVLPSFG